MSIPEPIQAYLDRLREQRLPTWLQVDADGVVTRAGGVLQVFKVNLPAVGERIEDVFPYAAGFELPENGTTTFECLDIAGAPQLDMHILDGDPGYWVLLLKSPRATLSQMELQQKLNEMALDYQFFARHMEESRFNTRQQNLELENVMSEILVGTDTLLLEQVEDGLFQPVTYIPGWVIAWFPDLARRRVPVDPRDFMPFLDLFFHEADTAWKDSDTAEIHSDVWQELDAQGHTGFFRAQFLRLGERRILAIRPAAADTLEKQELLQKARQAALTHKQLEKEVEKKQILLHCIVHDLKNPLTGMIGAFELLKPQNDEQEELIRMGATMALRQRDLISQILSAFSAEWKEWDPAEFDPAEAPCLVQSARNMVESLRHTLLHKQVDLYLEASLEPDESRVFAEEQPLERIIGNLVDNASRYAPAGSAIVVRVRGEEDHLLLEVEDEGPGVPEETIPRLFERFQTEGRQAGNVGLGLYFCNIMTKKWGGEISYYPAPDGGAGFRITLKALTVPAP